MDNSKLLIIPKPPGTIISKAKYSSIDIDIKRMCQVLYASTIGSIMYAKTCIRPNIAYVIIFPCRYQANQGESIGCL